MGDNLLLGEKTGRNMSDVNPWARLGSRPVHEEELTLVPSNDVILLRDQFLQLSKIVMLLSSRVDELEKGALEPIDNAFAIMSREELGLVDPWEKPLDGEELAVSPDTVIIKSGFTAPVPVEKDSNEESGVSKGEPVGSTLDDLSEAVVGKKEFGPGYDVAFIMVDLLTDYIGEHGAVLNNQVKKRVYSPVELNVSAGDKKKLKELIDEGHTRFKATKMDNFRTLYYIGEDHEEEYSKSYGSKSD